VSTTIVLPDGSTLQFDAPPTAHEAARAIGEGLARAAVAARIDGRLADLSALVPDGARFSVITPSVPEGVEIMRHSCAHIMAAAVLSLFPEAVFGIGPAIENGFYYDFELPRPLSPDDLPAIEKAMREIVSKKLPFERSEMSRGEALELFRSLGQYLKVELLEEMEEETVTVYRCGDFIDLCRGPHIPHTGRAPAFALSSIAGAYWRGDVRNRMLQRIYGFAFPDKKALKAHLRMLDEAKKRDHRKIGKEMDLFSFHEEGPGFPFFHPRGTAVLNEITAYWREEHRRAGYREIVTPTVLDCKLWHRSGHYENYADNMYFTSVDEREFALKPMNCPGAMLIYKTRVRSYKELPLRVAEMGRVHRHELSGVLHGLFRVRAFSIDDAHIFCEPGQVEEEILGVIRLLERIYRTFGFEKWYVELSTRPEKFIGSEEIWDRSTEMLHSALRRAGIEYDVDEGGGAFYGPKIDFKVFDSIGRMWQCGTVQLDFSMPARFELEYTGSDGRLHTPVLIHRAILGSLERFFGILIEDTAGKFPLWLAPVQARVMTVTDASKEYALSVLARLEEAGLRAEADVRNEKIGYKIRRATVENVPYMLVVGENEQASGTAALRHRKLGDLGPKPLDEIVEGLSEEYAARSRTSFWSEDAPAGQNS